MLKILLLTLPILCFISAGYAQPQTVGIFLNKSEAYKGYTLFTPIADSTTYLLDNCGRIVHTWKGPARSGFAYLLDDGTLLRQMRLPSTVFPSLGGGGVEKVDWDGNIIWEYQYSSDKYRQHHDFTILPNGNILLLAAEYKPLIEAVKNGRDSTTAPNGMWSEHIVEIEPIGKDSGTIVWEWHAWDHLIQDLDSSKLNFGKVSDHPELLDLNFPPGGNHDWLHANAIAYNAKYDQIVVSARMQSEIYIIDHSTTTAEAASHSGGNSNKGGDILYRWGNPLAYQRSTAADQQFYFQHNAHWIPNGLKGEGRIMVFNNGIGRPGGNFSSIDEIELPVDEQGNYSSPGIGTYLPLAPAGQYIADTPTSFYSALISGAHRLPNGNTFICEGQKGRFFEVDSTGQKVWEYINPVSNSGIVSQGAPISQNNVFRAYRYGENHPAFQGKTLSPQGYLEKDPWNYDCTIYKDTLGTGGLTSLEPGEISIYPNPTTSTLYIHYPHFELSVLYLYDITGKEMLRQELAQGINTYNMSGIRPGVYFCKILSDLKVLESRKIILR